MILAGSTVLLNESGTEDGVGGPRRRPSRVTGDTAASDPRVPAVSVSTTETSMAASYEAMRHFALPEAPLFEKCKAAIEAGGFSIVNADVAASRIVAKGGANWRSLGEQIELSVSGGGVHVRSSTTRAIGTRTRPPRENRSEPIDPSSSPSRARSHDSCRRG